MAGKSGSCSESIFSNDVTIAENVVSGVLLILTIPALVWEGGIYQNKKTAQDNKGIRSDWLYFSCFKL